METVGSKIVAEGADYYIDAMGRARDAHHRFTKVIEDESPKAGAASKGMGEVITGALRAVGQMAVTALAEAGKALAQFGLDSIDAASDFEASMLRLKSVAGGEIGEAGLSLDQFRDKALQLGKDTKYSAGEAQEAMINLAKGGVPVKDILSEASAAVLNLASAGEVELGPAAEIVAKQLGVWGNTGVTATNVTDMLAQAANASTVDVDDLALGMANVGSVAKTAGVSFEDTVKTMALIAPGFSSAADAGTSYKTFLNNLVPTTAKAKDASYELGLTYFDTSKAMETLKAAGIDASKMTEGQMVASLEKLAKRLKLSKGETKEWLESFDKSAFYDAQGNFVGMSKAAEILHDATKDLTVEQRALALETIFGADAQRAAAAIAEAGAAGLDKMTGAMNRAGTAADQAAQKNQGFKFAQEQLKGSIETLQIVIGSMLLPVLTQLFNDYLTPGVNTVMAFAEALGAAPDKMAFLQAAIMGVIPSMEGFGGIFTEVRNLIAIVMPYIQTVVSSVLTAVSGFWADNGADILKTAGEAYESIKQIIVLALQVINAAIKPALDQAAAWWRDNSDNLRTLLQVTWDAVKLIITTVLTVIQGVLKTALALMRGDWDGALKIIKDTWATIWANIYTTLSGILPQIIKAVNELMADIKRKVETVLKQVADAFREQWNEAVAIVRGVVGAAADAAGAVVNGMINRIQGAAGAIRQALVGPIEAAVASVRSIIDGLWNTFNALKSAAANFRLPTLPGGSNTNTSPPGIKSSSVRATPSMASAATMGGGSTTNITRSFNLTVNSRQSAGSIAQDFAILKALAV